MSVWRQIGWGLVGAAIVLGVLTAGFVVLAAPR